MVVSPERISLAASEKQALVNEEDTDGGASSHVELVSLHHNDIRDNDFDEPYDDNNSQTMDSGWSSPQSNYDENEATGWTSTIDSEKLIPQPAVRVTTGTTPRDSKKTDDVLRDLRERPAKRSSIVTSSFDLRFTPGGIAMDSKKALERIRQFQSDLDRKAMAKRNKTKKYKVSRVPGDTSQRKTVKHMIDNEAKSKHSLFGNMPLKKRKVKTSQGKRSTKKPVQDLAIDNAVSSPKRPKTQQQARRQLKRPKSKLQQHPQEPSKLNIIKKDPLANNVALSLHKSHQAELFAIQPFEHHKSKMHKEIKLTQLGIQLVVENPEVDYARMSAHGRSSSKSNTARSHASSPTRPPSTSSSRASQHSSKLVYGTGGGFRISRPSSKSSSRAGSRTEAKPRGISVPKTKPPFSIEAQIESSVITSPDATKVKLEMYTKGDDPLVAALQSANNMVLRSKLREIDEPYLSYLYNLS